MRCLFALPALATVVCAQVVPLGFSRGISVQAGAASAAILHGVDITTGTQLGVGHPTSLARFGFAPSWNATGIDLSWNVESVALAPGVTTGSASARHELWAGRPIDGRLVVSWTSTTSGNGATSFGLDLFDDGSIDATGPAVIPVSLPTGSTALRVDLTTWASAGVAYGPWGSPIPYNGAVDGVLSIRFEPTGCAITAFGTACGGPATSAMPNLFGGVTLTAQFPPADDLAIAIFGFDQQPSSLPLSPGCALLTTPLATSWQPVGPTGTITWSTALPPGIGPVAFAAQTIGLDVDAWSATTSGGFWVSCQ